MCDIYVRDKIRTYENFIYLIFLQRKGYFCDIYFRDTIRKCEISTSEIGLEYVRHHKEERIFL